jgi:hypothetical protein
MFKVKKKKGTEPVQQPPIGVNMEQFPSGCEDMFDLKHFDVASLFDQLRSTKKALSIPMLKEEFRQKLVQVKMPRS